jgi:putative transposase
MKKERFSVEQIVGVLKQVQVEVPVAEVIRKAGISEQAFFRGKAKFAGLEVEEVRRMAQLQEENAAPRDAGSSPHDPCPPSSRPSPTTP